MLFIIPSLSSNYSAGYWTCHIKTLWFVAYILYLATLLGVKFTLNAWSSHCWVDFGQTCGKQISCFLLTMNIHYHLHIFFYEKYKIFRYCMKYVNTFSEFTCTWYAKKLQLHNIMKIRSVKEKHDVSSFISKCDIHNCK